MRITEAESVVLGALWRQGPLSFADLIAEVRARSDWGDATIKTLLHRLMQKGAVRSEKTEGRQRYHAVLERRAYVEAEIDDLVARLFGGDRAALRQVLAADDEPSLIAAEASLPGRQE